jgi:four helix bundle protein
MNKIKSFEDFDAFKLAREFCRAVGKIVRSPAFSDDRSLRWQIEKSLISILSNFAEEFERDGRQEFIQFLTIAKGSAGEARAQLIYAYDQGLIDEVTFQSLHGLGVRVSTIFGGLLKHLSQSEYTGIKFKKFNASPEPLTVPERQKGTPFRTEQESQDTRHEKPETRNQKRTGSTRPPRQSSDNYRAL